MINLLVHNSCTIVHTCFRTWLRRIDCVRAPTIDPTPAAAAEAGAAAAGAEAAAAGAEAAAAAGAAATDSDACMIPSRSTGKCCVFTIPEVFPPTAADAAAVPCTIDLNPAAIELPPTTLRPGLSTPACMAPMG